MHIGANNTFMYIDAITNVCMPIIHERIGGKQSEAKKDNRSQKYRPTDRQSYESDNQKH